MILNLKKTEKVRAIVRLCTFVSFFTALEYLFEIKRQIEDEIKRQIEDEIKHQIEKRD